MPNGIKRRFTKLLQSLHYAPLTKNIITCNGSEEADFVFIYSNKKDTSDFHGIVYFYPVKMSQQKINQNVYRTSDT